MTERDCLIEPAVQLYVLRCLPIGSALRLCGLTRIEFEHELAQRDIALYSVDDLERDFGELEELGRQ